ncbi:MAG: reverse transcriptase/maturase family protein [Candidatus Shapirobacteria bacterium]|nr:reverse transcriptase/maturase family protein [Candidatus Shapirobacteria bacterium]
MGDKQIGYERQTLPSKRGLSMFEQIYDLESLCAAFKRAQLDNRYKRKICAFCFSLEENLLRLNWELQRGSYVPSPYTYFMLHDPKIRAIAAPDFRDRVVQHALVDCIQPILEKQFIYDSFACREEKGTHFAARRVKRFLMAARSLYGSQTPIYVLQCDIRKFFQSVSWDILLGIVQNTITCPKTFALIRTIVTTHYNALPPTKTDSCQMSLFSKSSVGIDASISVATRTGLPIGNLTSQLLANVYLNELDHFIKDRLRLRWYARYMDDFLVIHPDRVYLKQLCDQINIFLKDTLHLSLHPKKLTIKNVSDGVPFVGYRIFYDHVLIRGNTLRRIEKNYRSKTKQLKNGRFTEEKLDQTKASITGHLKHANSYGLTKKIFSK